MTYVVDDLMQECCKSKALLDAFIRGSHHRNCNVIFITQNFFQQGLRPITMNAKYIACFKNPRDSGYVDVLGRQMNGGRKNKYCEEAFEHAISKPYGYLFMDLSQEQNDKCRLRNNIFPYKDCVVYVKS